MPTTNVPPAQACAADSARPAPNSSDAGFVILDLTRGLPAALVYVRADGVAAWSFASATVSCRPASARGGRKGSTRRTRRTTEEENGAPREAHHNFFSVVLRDPP